MPTYATPAGQMSPADMAALAADAQRKQNRAFMALSLNKETLCLAANGSATSQAWNGGQPLTFTVPSANNGFLTGFWVRAALTVTLGAGTGAAYTLNAGAPLNIFDSIIVNYGGTQHNLRPYIMKYLSQFRGATAQTQPRTIVAGQSDAYLQAYYASTTPVAVGANTWNISFYVPMNLIHPQDVRGILPIQNGQTSCQVIVNCSNAVLGADPIINTVVTSAGTGGTATVAGNVSVIAEYKDGASYSQMAALQPNLSGIETVQLQRDTLLNNITAGQVMRNKVSFLHKIPWLIAVVVDGNQSNKFANTSNIQIIETSADSTGNKPFMRVGANSNLDVREFYNDLSGKFGGLLQQDFDEGVLPLVFGPIFQQADAGMMEGAHYLDCTQASGWTDFHYGVQLGSVGSVSGVTPRIETHVVYLNEPLVV